MTVYLIAQPTVPRQKPDGSRGQMDMTPLYEHGEVRVLVQAGEYPGFHPARCLDKIEQRLADFNPDTDCLAWLGGDTLSAVLTGFVLATKLHDVDDPHVTYLRFDRARLPDGSRDNTTGKYIPVRVPLFTDQSALPVPEQVAAFAKEA